MIPEKIALVGNDCYHAHSSYSYCIRLPVALSIWFHYGMISHRIINSRGLELSQFGNDYYRALSRFNYWITYSYRVSIRFALYGLSISRNGTICSAAPRAFALHALYYYASRVANLIRRWHWTLKKTISAIWTIILQVWLPSASALQ